MISSLLLVLAFGVSGQAGQAPPAAQTTPELSVLVERVVRLADLQRRKLDLEQELAAKKLGVQHPESVRIQMQLAEIVSAIRREGLESYHSDAHALADRRITLETQLSRLRVGHAHPEFQQLSTQIAAIKEQERLASVALLAAGVETELKAVIARQPNNVQTYLELAGLLITAGRADEASALLLEAQAALKRSGGR